MSLAAQKHHNCPTCRCTEPLDEVSASGVERLVSVQADTLERWELHRQEMTNHMDRLSKLAINFIELGAFDDAAKCAIKAEGLKYVLGRMPPPAH